MVRERVCRYCGAENPAAFRCWLCGSVAPLGRGALASAGSSPPAKPHATPTFGLSALMLAVAGMAVLFGVFRSSSGIGVALLVLATPAIIQTVRVESESPWAKLGVFMGTLGVTVAVIVASIAAFLVVCAGIMSQTNFH